MRAGSQDEPAAMPVEPLFGLGFTPVLQWLILPLAILLAAGRRELRSE